MRRTLALLCLLVTCALPLGAPAQERVLSPARAVGYQGIVTQCISFVRIDWANDLCGLMSEGVGRLAADAGLGHLDLGRTEWGYGSDLFLPLPDPMPFADPVHLTFYIRATEGPTSAHVWVSLYRDMGPEGRLVLFEDSGIGAGEASTLRDGLSAGLVRKLEPVIQTLGAN